MTAISKYFGEGGANLVTGDGAGKPSLADTLRDIADDLASFKGTAPTSTPLPTFSNPPTVGEMAVLQTTINELLGRATTRSSSTLLTTKI